MLNIEIWDHIKNPTYPLNNKCDSEQNPITIGRKILMTLYPNVDPPSVHSVIEVARQCPQHTFLVNLASDQGWYNLPQNVFPVFNFTSKDGKPYYNCLEDDLFGDKPKIINIFGNSKFPIEHVNLADWVMVYGNHYDSVAATLDNVQRMNSSVYFLSFNGRRRIKTLPKRFQIRRVPFMVERLLTDKLLGKI